MKKNNFVKEASLALMLGQIKVNINIYCIFHTESIINRGRRQHQLVSLKKNVFTCYE